MALKNTQMESQEPRRITGDDSVEQTSLRQEIFWLVLILAAGLLPRLIFIRSFPTRPISDFLNMVGFAQVFRDDIFARNAWQWHFFSPGLPLILSVLLDVIHKSPETIGRWATAFATGLVPLVPYLLWKGVFRLRARVIAALLFALWAGQILFSSVVAQDNWILFPTVAVAALAVRALAAKKDESFPVLAALLYAATVAVRQEMLIALLPAAVVAILGRGSGRWFRNSLTGALIIGVIFSALVYQRGVATGRYTLKTDHLGSSFLGAYIPGAGMGWISPVPYLEAARPELMKNGNLSSEVEQEALILSKQEFLRRPMFHLIRIFGSTLTNLFEMDQQVLWWSLGSEEVLPHKYREDARMLMKNLLPLLKYYQVVINTLFCCSLFFALGQRHLLKWISPILVTIVLKTGLHAVIVSQPRYFLVVTALEMLVIALVWDRMLIKENWKLSLGSIFAGIVSVFLLMTAMNSAREYVVKHDVVFESGYKYCAAVNSTLEPRSIQFHEIYPHDPFI